MAEKKPKQNSKQQHRLMLRNISHEIKIRNICLDMIKFAVFDFVPIRRNLDDATSAFAIFLELDNVGYIKPDDVTLLIALFKLLWLDALNDILLKPKFPIENVDPKEVFSSFRISIVNLSNKLKSDDIKEIADVFAVPMEKSSNPWKLFQYLQDSDSLCEDNLNEFMEQTRLKKDFLKWLPAKAFPIQTERVRVTLQRNQSEAETSDISAPCLNLPRPEDDPQNKLHHLAHIDRPNEQLAHSVDDAGDLIFETGNLCTGIGNSSIVFHISSYDPKALKNLWAMCSNGQLLKKLSETLVIEKYKQQFLLEWKIIIDENQFNYAVSKLEKKAVESTSMKSALRPTFGSSRSSKTSLRPRFGSSRSSKTSFSSVSTSSQTSAKFRSELLVWSKLELKIYFNGLDMN